MKSTVDALRRRDDAQSGLEEKCADLQDACDVYLGQTEQLKMSVEALTLENARLITERRLTQGQKWLEIVRRSPSGKTLFVCTYCGRVSPTPDKTCQEPVSGCNAIGYRSS